MPKLVYRGHGGRVHTQVSWGRVNKNYLSNPVIAEREITEDEATLPLSILKARYPLVNSVIRDARELIKDIKL